MTRACSRGGEVGAAWEYIYIESDSKHRKKPVRSRGQRSGVRILDNIDVIISRGPISRNTQPDTCSFAPRSYAEHRSDGKAEDGSSATLFTYYTDARFILGLGLRDILERYAKDTSLAAIVVRSLFNSGVTMASKIEKLRRLENAPEFRRVPLSQGPVTFPSSSLLLPVP